MGDAVRVLIAGAGGFIGRHLVSHVLATTDWDIVAVTRGEPAHTGHPRVSHLRVDLRNEVIMECVDKAIGHVDVVVNLAASSDVATFLQDPVAHTLNNVTSTLNLLEWARRRTLQSFIQVSTNEVYGPSEPDATPAKEWAPLIPQTPYSASKAAQEMLAIGWQRTYDVPVTIVNTMHVFGEGQPANRFIPTAVRKILTGAPVPLYRYADGSAVRNWIYVGDLVHAIRHIAERYAGAQLERWNVAGPELSCQFVARQIGAVLGVDEQVDWVDDVVSRRPGYDYRYALDPTKLANSWWVPPFGFAAGLERTVKHFATEGDTP